MIHAGGNISLAATSAATPTSGLPNFLVQSVDLDANTVQVNNHGLQTGDVIEYDNNAQVTGQQSPLCSTSTPIAGLQGATCDSATAITNWINGTHYNEGDLVRASNNFLYTAKVEHTASAATNPANDNGVSAGMWERNPQTVVIRRQYNALVTDANNVGFGTNFTGAPCTPTATSCVDSARDTILFGSAHHFVTGDAVKYAPSGDTGVTVGGLNTTNTYYVVVLDDRTIRLVVDQNQITNPAAFVKAFTPANVSGDTIMLGSHNLQVGDALVYNGPSPITFSSGQVDTAGGTITGGAANLTDTASANNLVFIDPTTGAPTNQPFALGDKVLYRVTSGDGTAPAPIGGVLHGPPDPAVPVTRSTTPLHLD